MDRSESLDRRWLLGGAAGAALLGLAACTTPESPVQPKAGPGEPRIDVRGVGAIGDGQADDSQAFATALEQAGEQRTVYIPTGTYRLSRLPDLKRYTTMVGDGPDRSILVSEGERPLLNLKAESNRASFRSFSVHVVHPNGVGARLSGAFMCGFEDVVFRGDHQGRNFPKYAGQIGVDLINNAGANTFTNCFFTNFGVGLRVASIQNYVSSCRFLTNRIGVLGVQNGANAGLSLVNSEFTSDTHLQTTDVHLLVEGLANVWWLTNVWFEGSEVAVRIGGSGGGPAQFGLVNCKLAARRVALELRNCKQAYLANIALDPDAFSRPTPLVINAEGCPNGTAEELIVDQRRPVDPAVFPPGWTVQGAGQRSGGEFLAPLVVRSRPGQPLTTHLDSGGNPIGGVLADGSMISDRPDAGIVLRGAGGNYFRLTVTTDGLLLPVDLGPKRPG